MLEKKKVRFVIESTERTTKSCHECNSRMFLRPRKLFQLLVGTSVALAYIQFQLLSVTERRQLTQSISSALGIESHQFLKSSCIGLPSLVGFTNFTTRNINDIGGLNTFSWHNIKGKRLESFLQSVAFPKKPNSARIIKLTRAFLQETNYGLWIFGYIIPAVSGKYKFAISSDDTSELWLSESANPKEVRKIASVEDYGMVAWTLMGEYTKYSSQISEEIFLEKCKPYFIEILFKQNDEDGFVDVAWRFPKTSAFNFEVIHGDFLLPFALIDDKVNNTEVIKVQNINREVLWNRHIQRRDRLMKVTRLKNPRNRAEELEGLVEQVVEKDF